MNNKLLISLVTFFFIFTQADCKRKRVEKISISNKSSHSIYTAYSFNYPDTTLSNGLIDQPTIPTAPNDEKVIQAGLDVFNQNPTFQIFFIHADTLNQKGWDYVKSNNIYISRKQLIEQQIIDDDYYIYFP
jgi:hypothetical protein